MKTVLTILLSALILVVFSGCAVPENTTATTALKSGDTFTGNTAEKTQDLASQSVDFQTTGTEKSALDEAYDSIIKGYAPRISTLNKLTLEEFKAPILSMLRNHLYQQIKDQYNHYDNSLLEAYGLKRVDDCIYSEDGRILYYYSKLKHEEKTTAEVKEGTEIIFSGAFANEKELEEIILPESVLYIGSDAFYKCDNLKTIRIRSDKEIFCSFIFGEFTGITASGSKIEKDYYLEALEESGLNKVPQIENINDDFVVENGILVAYHGIGGVVNVPEGVTEIRSGIFSHCRFNITQINFPTTLNKVSADFIDGGFQRLAILDFPDGVMHLPEETINEKNGKLNCLYVSVAKNCVVAENALPGSRDSHTFELTFRD